MNKDEAAIVASMFPRYAGKGIWVDALHDPRRPVKAFLNLRMVSNRVDKRLSVGGTVSRRCCRIEMIDVRAEWGRLRFLQTGVLTLNLLFHVLNFGAVSRRRKALLPVLVRVGDLVVVWDGTHRTVAAMLLGRKLRCAVMRLEKNRK